jgi:7-cyano-7-deazaguanine synthase
MFLLPIAHLELQITMTHAFPRAVVLVSGGMDSAVTLALARERGFGCYALSVAYGQRHSAELAAAAHNAHVLGAIAHKTVAVDLRSIGGSALTAEIDVPEAGGAGIPITYVPARNTIMLSIALAWAEVLGATDLFCGVNAVDYSGYPDCRPAFIAAFEHLARVATQAAVAGRALHVHAPLMAMGKADIVREGLRLGVISRRPCRVIRPMPKAAPARTATRAVCARRDFMRPASPIPRAMLFDGRVALLNLPSLQSMPLVARDRA